jgi:uncharacterized protein
MTTESLPMPKSPIHGRQNDLHRAIEKGDIAAVRAWIAAGKPLEDRDPTAMTPLALAAYFNRPTIFHELLSAGAAIKATDDGNHVLFYAAARGNRNMVQALLDRKVDVNFRSAAPGNSGQTALIGAAKEGHLEIAQLLYSHHADLSPTDFQGKTALDVADENGADDVVAFLKAFKAPGKAVSKRPAKPHPGEKLAEAARKVVGKFPALAARPKYTAFVARLATVTGRKPKAFTNPDAFEFGKLKGVFAVEFPAKVLADQPDVVDEMAVKAAAAGGTLVRTDPTQDPAKGVSCVLYPTTDKVAVILARETSSNGTVGADTEDIAAFVADLDKDNPFRLTACAGDLIVGEFGGPVRKARTVARRILDLCSEGDDDPDDLAQTLKEDRAFFLWWD